MIDMKIFKQFELNQNISISISFQMEWDMIVVAVFSSILNQMEFHLVQDRMENCHHDHIPFNVKGNGDTIFSLHNERSTDS